jgi:hypothetical protein
MGERNFYLFADLPRTRKTLRKGEKYTADLRIQVERALRRAFIERARGDSGPTRPLNLATLTHFRNSSLSELERND